MRQRSGIINRITIALVILAMLIGSARRRTGIASSAVGERHPDIDAHVNAHIHFDRHRDHYSDIYDDASDDIHPDGYNDADRTSTLTSNETETTMVFHTVTDQTEVGPPSIGAITAANITVGGLSDSTGEVAVDPLTNMVYIPGSSGLTVINENTNQVVTTIMLHGGSSSADVDDQTDVIYANNASCSSCSQSLFVISGASNSLIDTVDLGQGINGVVVDQTNDMVYASSIGPVSLFMIDVMTNSVTANVTLPSSPQGFPVAAWGVTVDTGSGMVYVPTCPLSLICGPNIVYEINGTNGSIADQFPISGPAEGGKTLAISMDSSTDTVYMTVGNILVSINASTKAENTYVLSALPLNCPGLAVGSGEDEIYVTCLAGPNIPSFIVIDGGNGGIVNSFTQVGLRGVAIAFGYPNAEVVLVDANGFVLAVLRTSTLGA